MEIELTEIRDFIAQHPPFDVLDSDALNKVPRYLIIRYFRRGHIFPDSDSHNAYVIRSGAIEFRDQQNQLIDKLAEGEVYLHDASAEQLEGLCVEDTLVYLLPGEKLQQLRESSELFDRQFSQSINERLRDAVERSQEAGIRDLNAMKMEVLDLTDRPPVIVDATITIQQAAEKMNQENVSSILVTLNDELVGLVTDRDIRSRCVAKAMSYSEPVSEIMSSQLVTIQDTALLSEALLAMTRNKIHHLPLMNKKVPVGVLTTSDVIRHISTSSALIATDISKANSVDVLIKISSRLPELQLQLSLSSATSKHIGEVISSITDAITCRLIELAESLYGAAPVEYVWVAGGSQARNEQTSHSDQDNALIISDKLTVKDTRYFTQLADFVCEGLNSCGYVFCPGDAMAKNEQWRQPLNNWIQTFSEWINMPEPKALMLSSIFFDLRPVYGDFALFNALQKKVIEQTSSNELFIAHMVNNSLKHQPPLGFFRNFVLVHDDKHKNTLDIKRRGIAPIVDIARILALANGISDVNTVDRLDAAMECKALSSEMHANLIDALEFIGSLRVRHQSQQIRSSTEVDNYLPPVELSGLEKSHLKDSFAVIKTMQQFLESRFQSSQMG